MSTETPGKARQRILFWLKTKGPQTAADIAGRLGVTPMAVRQHLYQLHEDGDVEFTDERRSVGRPARVWNLTSSTESRFPDSHGELTVGLLRAATRAFGAKGIARMLDERASDQVETYTRRVTRKRGLPAKVAELAKIRNEEGYMAEWHKEGDGTLVLVENHCPICAAATECNELCHSELRVFREVLGAEVQREEHILSGQRRCLYRIRKQAG